MSAKIDLPKNGPSGLTHFPGRDPNKFLTQNGNAVRKHSDIPHWNSKEWHKVYRDGEEYIRVANCGLFFCVKMGKHGRRLHIASDTIPSLMDVLNIASLRVANEDT